MIVKTAKVQSILPIENVIALKVKTGQTTVREVISRAVYHLLKCSLSSPSLQNRLLWAIPSRQKEEINEVNHENNY
jgi:hypothetical protein